MARDDPALTEVMMPVAELPQNGESVVGSVRLPEGRRTHAHGARDGSVHPPVAWVTIRPVPDPGAVWAALSQAGAHTGLVPFLARTMLGSPWRPWDDGTRWPGDGFCHPLDLAPVDLIDPAAVLQAGWARHAWVPAEEEEPDPEELEWAQARITPYSRDFPGLAPAGDQALDQGEVRAAISCLPPARIGLAAADRPADALAAMGWIPGNWFDGTEQVTAVLRSWEDRFGARLLAVGPDSFKLLAERPPRDVAAAQRVAAELFALTANEYTCAWDDWALTEVGEITDSLIRSPIWGFWWD